MSSKRKQSSIDQTWRFAQQGETFRLTGYYDEALAYFNQALDHDPAYTWALAHRGATYLQLGRYEAALADLNAAIDQKPGYVWAHAQRGEVYYLMGPDHYQQALQDFDQAISLDDQYAWAYAHRGQIYRFMGPEYYEQALGDFNKATELNPTYAWAWGFRYTIKSLQGDYKEALYDFLVATELDKEIFSHPFHELTYQFAWLGRFEEALAMHMKAKQKDPQDHLALYNVAVLRGLSESTEEIQTEIDQARSRFDELLNTDNHGMALYGLGGLAALEGDHDAALDYLEEAIAHSEDRFFIEWAMHDLAWKNLRTQPQFAALAG